MDRRTGQTRQLTTAYLRIPSGAGCSAPVTGYWIEAVGYQRFLYLAGGLLLLSAAFHTVILLATGGPLTGDVSWRKPILFGEAFGLTALTVAWVMTFLPKRNGLGWILAGTLGVANVGEVFWVAMQQWRGVPSHFNNSTPFDAAAFTAAGFLISLAGIVILIVTLQALFSLQASRSLAWAIRIGLLLLVAAQVFGALMIIRGSGTFTPAGAMKVPHALALHAPQVLLLLAWLLTFTKLRENRRTGVLMIAAGGCVLLVAVSAFQSLNGIAPFDFGLVLGLLVAAGAAGIVYSYATALLTLKRTRT